jgi:LPS-assembly protein
VCVFVEAVPPGTQAAARRMDMGGMNQADQGTAASSRRHRQAILRGARRVALGLVLLLGLLGISKTGAAQDVSAGLERLAEGSPDAPWHITADEITYDNRTRQYVAEGNVQITREGRKLTADLIRFDHLTMEVVARGHVVLSAGGDVLIGDRAELDLQRETGTITNGTIFLHENHFYITGERIAKVGEASYELEDASVSSCDGERPAWKITGRRLDVTLEGYGVVRHAALWAKNVPVAYAPLFVFPAKRQRQSGLLSPEFGTSRRQGIFWNQPLYWAIDEQSDATLFTHYMSDRGLKMGAEARYVRDEATRGTVMVDYLKDRQVDDGVGDDSDDWGYTSDRFLRENQDRWWLRMKHDQGLPFGAAAQVDLDMVSDQDYLIEFRRGLTGFEESRDYFQETFGRDLDDYNDPVRVNRVRTYRTWDPYQLDAGLLWLQDSRPDEREDGQAFPDTTLQRLPFANFSAIRTPLGGSGFLMGLNSEYTYLYSASDDNSTGHRVDAHPRIYYPLRLGPYLSVEPSAGIRQTAWFMDDFQDLPETPEEPGKDSTQFRTLYDLKLDMASEFQRVFALGGEELQSIRHLVRPQVVYEYIPPENQDDLPKFFSIDESGERHELDDGVNFIDRLNRVTYSVTNTFTSKSRKPADSEAPAAAGSTAAFRYNDFARLKFKQSYDLLEARGDRRQDPERKRPFSPIRAELELFPENFLRLKANTEWDVYDQRVARHDLRATLSTPRGDRFDLEYRFNRAVEDDEEDVESLFGSLRLELPYHLTAYFSHEYDLDRGERIESVLGCIYRSQCWSLDLRLSGDDEENKVTFLVTLYGLGGIGSQ